MRADQQLTAIAWRRTGGSARQAALTGQTVTVGRAPGNDLVIGVDAVSKHHARFDRVSNGWQVRDVGSSNGTLLNSQPLRGVALVSAGDRLTIGGEDVVVNGAVLRANRRLSMAAVRAIAGAIALALVTTLVARTADRGDVNRRRLAVAPSASRFERPTAPPAGIVDEVRRRALAAGVDLPTAWLQEAQRARWVGRLGDAMRLTAAVLKRDPDSKPAALRARRLEEEIAAHATRLERQAALAGAIRDDTAASGCFQELVQLLEPGDPVRARAEASLQRLARSSARPQPPEERP